MDITGSYTFNAPPDRVWDVMMDPPLIASCIPGCERLEPDGVDRYRAGITIGLGTDSGVPNNMTFGRFQGYLEHMELELMVESGLTPMQVLTAATSTSARIMRLDPVGTITPGKAADLLVLDANPLQDIRNTRQINSVWIGGRRLASTGTN